MVLSASGTISRSCWRRIVRMTEVCGRDCTLDLPRVQLRPIESDRRRKVKVPSRRVRGPEGCGIEIGWGVGSDRAGLRVEGVKSRLSLQIFQYQRTIQTV